MSSLVVVTDLTVCINTEESASMTEECSKYYLALIILSSLLTVSLFTNVGLTVGVLRIKGKLSCMKGI